MCRRCGEADRRGSNRNRRASRQWLLDTFGNGVITSCTWCPALVANREHVGPWRIGDQVLEVVLLERDRLEPGGPYARWNLVPACGPCNKARAYEAAERGQLAFPEGCEYGTAAVA